MDRRSFLKLGAAAAVIPLVPTALLAEPAKTPTAQPPAHVVVPFYYPPHGYMAIIHSPQPLALDVAAGIYGYYNALPHRRGLHPYQTEPCFFANGTGMATATSREVGAYVSALRMCHWHHVHVLPSRVGGLGLQYVNHAWVHGADLVLSVDNGVVRVIKDRGVGIINLSFQV